MRSLCWAVLPLLVLASCGIETIEYLPPPQASNLYPNQDYTAQSDYTQLTFQHNSSAYSSTSDFQGYEVYYKIYPTASSIGLTSSGNLALDVSNLSTAPTRDYLITLGYQRMSASDQNSGTLPLIGSLPGSATITLSFRQFLTGMSVPNPPTTHTSPPQIAPTTPGNAPIPTMQVGSAAQFPIFRTVTTNGLPSYPWFSDLYNGWAGATSDMQRAGTNAISTSTQSYEIDVFLVAYAFTPESTIYSQPVPWGVLAPLGVS